MARRIGEEPALSDAPDPVESLLGVRTGRRDRISGVRLDALFRRHSRDLLAFFLRRTGGDASRAEDLVQEVFLSAASGLERREATAPTVAWLYTVAHRRLIDDLRRSGRQVPTVPIDDVYFELTQPPAYGDGVARALTLAVRDLPAIQRRVFVMKVLEGRPFSEIGARIGTSEGAARMHLMRALKTIRSDLEALEVEP